MGLCTGLIAAELLLQALALVTVKATERAQDGGLATVLCCGDSFTFGMGASTPSNAYPARLESALRMSGFGTAVVANAGWPGQTSRDVLIHLEKELSDRRPKLVYVLVGINDVGWQPSKVSASEEAQPQAADRWRFELRLPKLAHTILQWADGGPSYSRHGSEGFPFLGLWHQDDLELAIERGGQLRIGTSVCAWRTEGDKLLLRSAVNVESETRWNVVNDRLTILMPGQTAPLTFLRGASPRRAPLGAAWQALSDGDARKALAVVAPLIGDLALGREARKLRFVALAELGEETTLDAELATLEKAAASGTPLACDEWIEGLLAAGRIESALNTEIRIQERGIEHTPLASMLLDLSVLPSRHRKVQERFAELLENGKVHPRLRPWILRWRALDLRERSPGAALTAIVEAQALEPNDAFTGVMLRHPAFDSGMLDAVLDARKSTQSERKLMHELLASGAGNSAAVAETLLDHYRRIAARCHAHGATCVLLGYPFAERVVDLVLEKVRRAGEAQTLEVRTHFDTVLRAKRWDELFVIDGHCNDAGYQVLAELVAKDAERRLR